MTLGAVLMNACAISIVGPIGAHPDCLASNEHPSLIATPLTRAAMRNPQYEITYHLNKEVQ